MPTPGRVAARFEIARTGATRMFVSYDHDNDRLYRRLLEAWNANREFELDFSDPSPGFSPGGLDEALLKRSVAAKIDAADIFLCLVGTHTHACSWVAWEIGHAFAIGKEIVAVKVDSANATPPALIEAGARWAMSFTLDSIRRAGRPE